MDKKIIGILLIAILAMVSTASLSYYAANQLNQTGNNSSPTLTSTPTLTPTPSPNETPTEPASKPTLSVPEFTIKIADNSYDVPTTYSIDKFTGETITYYGYHVENRTIEVTIKNQPFTSTNIDGNTTQLFYAIRWKGHFENWSDTYHISGVDYNYYLRNYGAQASNSDYTVRAYTLESFGNVPADGRIDFQVKAQVGYSFAYYGSHALIMPIGTNFRSVEESNWSNTQTITVP